MQTSKIHSHIIKLKIPRMVFMVFLSESNMYHLNYGIGCSVLQLHMLKFTYVEACTHKCRRCAEIKHERFEWAPGRSKVRAFTLLDYFNEVSSGAKTYHWARCDILVHASEFPGFHRNTSKISFMLHQWSFPFIALTPRLIATRLQFYPFAFAL